MSKELDKKRCGANVEKVIIDEFVPSKKTGLYALAELQHSVIDHYYLNNGNNPTYREDVEIIAKDLQRLEAIDNANPSEALSMFRSVELTLKENHLLNDGGWLIDYINIIKQALLKAQEQEKENEILKEIIKSLFDRGCPLHQYIDKDFGLTIEVDSECSIMHLGEFEGVDLNEKLQEVLEND